MQFSSTSGEKGLFQDAQFLTGTDSNSFPVADFTRLCNRWYYKAVLEAWHSSDDWEFDDTNQTGFAIATATLVDSQADYALPSNALKIRRVEVKDAAGNWSIVRPIDERQIGVALDEFYETDGLPKYFRLERNSLVLYPAPLTASVTLTAGLKLYFLREIDEFATSDTSQEPGLPEPFHRILSYGAAYDFCTAKNLPQAVMYRQEVEVMLRDLRTFMSNRNISRQTRLRPRIRNYV